jgi:hypothetical protein
VRQRRFKSANYPVAERRHLLEQGTVWISGIGKRRVLLTRINDYALYDGATVNIAFLAPGRTVPPRAVRLRVDSFLRNYRREDEEAA